MKTNKLICYFLSAMLLLTLFTACSGEDIDSSSTPIEDVSSMAVSHISSPNSSSSFTIPSTTSKSSVSSTSSSSTSSSTSGMPTGAAGANSSKAPPAASTPKTSPTSVAQQPAASSIPPAAPVSPPHSEPAPPASTVPDDGSTHWTDGSQCTWVFHHIGQDATCYQELIEVYSCSAPKCGMAWVKTIEGSILPHEYTATGIFIGENEEAYEQTVCRWCWQPQP